MDGVTTSSEVGGERTSTITDDSHQHQHPHPDHAVEQQASNDASPTAVENRPHESELLHEQNAGHVLEPEQESELIHEQGPGLEPEQGLGLEPEQGLGVEPEQGLGVDTEQGLGVEPEQVLEVEPEQRPGVEPAQELGAEPAQELGVEPEQKPSVEPELPRGQKHKLEPEPEEEPKPEWQQEKENYLSMGREERRLRYFCDDRYCEYNDVNFPGASMKDKTSWDKICVWRGDITSLEIDAIVNAANERMRGGGGVDGAIHSAAGPSLLKESIYRFPHGCNTGEAKVTGGYKLPAKYIIHTVGPRDRSAQKLRKCYKSVLDRALQHNLKHVAIPCISTGIFGYPNEDAANVALETVRDWLNSNPNYDLRVIFCVFLPRDESIYNDLIYRTRYKPPVPEPALPVTPVDPVSPPPPDAVSQTSTDRLLGTAESRRKDSTEQNNRGCFFCRCGFGCWQACRQCCCD